MKKLANSADRIDFKDGSFEYINDVDEFGNMLNDKLGFETERTFRSIISDLELGIGDDLADIDYALMDIYEDLISELNEDTLDKKQIKSLVEQIKKISDGDFDKMYAKLHYDL